MRPHKMKKKNHILKEILVDYVRFYYMGYLKNVEKEKAVKIFETLIDKNIDVSDFVPIMRQMQYDLDMIGDEKCSIISLK